MVSLAAILAAAEGAEQSPDAGLCRSQPRLLETSIADLAWGQSKSLLWPFEAELKTLIPDLALPFTAQDLVWPFKAQLLEAMRAPWVGVAECISAGITEYAREAATYAKRWRPGALAGDVLAVRYHGPADPEQVAAAEQALDRLAARYPVSVVFPEQGWLPQPPEWAQWMKGALREEIHSLPEDIGVSELEDWLDRRLTRRLGSYFYGLCVGRSFGAGSALKDPAGDGQVQVPSRPGDRRKWVALWRIVRPFVEQGMKLDAILGRLARIGNAWQPDVGTLRKVIRAGEDGHLG